MSEDDKPKLKVIPFTKKEKVEPKEPEYPPDKVLEMSKGQYSIVLAAGWTKDESLNYILSDGIDAAEAILILELVKNDILMGMLDE